MTPSSGVSAQAVHRQWDGMDPFPPVGEGGEGRGGERRGGDRREGREGREEGKEEGRDGRGARGGDERVHGTYSVYLTVSSSVCPSSLGRVQYSV